MRALWSARREQAAERLQHLRFEVGAEAVVAPGLAHLRLRAGAVALREQGARERELPLAVSGGFLAK